MRVCRRWTIDVGRKPRKTGREVAEEIVLRLREAGHVALLAGGCVRDLMLNRQPKDFDVATDATPDRVVHLFRRTEKVGAKFGVVIVRQSGRMVEVATFRSDGDYSDGRHPEKVTFADAEQDVQRRDFTINGMFYDPVEDKVLDYVGGMADLRQGVVRAIGDPAQRFAEDHLRMLRAVRFAARFSFTIDPATSRSMHELADRIRLISAERIRTEMVMILTEPTRRRGWELIHEHGLSAWLVKDTRWTDDEAGEAAARLGSLPEECSEPLALAALLGKYPPTDAARSCRRLTCSNQIISDTRWLLEQLPRVLTCESFEPADFKLLMAHQRADDLTALLAADVAARGLPGDSLRIWRERTSAIPPEDVAPPRMVNGDDLLALGLTPGPMFSKVLTELYRRQLNGRFSSREEALAAVADLIAAPPDSDRG